MHNTTIDISIIYVYYNTPKEIKESIISLKREISNFRSEIIIVDNNSQIPLPKEVISQKEIIIIKNKKNEGYGKALNQASIIAQGKYLLMLNPDTLFLKNSIKSILSKLEVDNSIGILGPQILDEKQMIQKVGTSLPTIANTLFAFSFLNKLFPKNKYSRDYYIYDFDRKSEREIPVICGACMFIKNNLLQKIGGFDEQFFMYFEEVDLCYRIKKTGYKVLYYPKAKVIHYIGRSSSDKKFIRKIYEQSRFKFLKKYNNILLAVMAETFLRVVNTL